MTTVTVDLEDLETLVFVSAAIKTIESALAARHRDPFVVPHLANTAAHERLATAMRHAQRSAAGDGATVVAWDEPLTDEEADVLQSVLDAENPRPRRVGPPYLVIEGDEKAPKKREVMSAFDRVAAKGGLIMGQLAAGVVWAGAPQAELIPRPGYGVKSTPRGREKLKEWADRRVIEGKKP